MFQHYIRLVLYFPSTQSTLFSGFFKFCKHIDLQFPSFLSPFPHSTYQKAMCMSGLAAALILTVCSRRYLAPTKLHTWENLSYGLFTLAEILVEAG